MSIYRGPGGSGDAVNDASSEAILTVEAKDAAIAAQLAAEAAQAGAETAEDNAGVYANNAATSASNAASSATAAAGSATTAATQASLATSNGAAQVALATTQANNAASSASAAATSASNASTYATNSQTYATNAGTGATQAANSAAAASGSATSAANSATNAATSASSAATSASNAASSVASAVAIYGNITDVQNAAASANAAYDSFDDRYLGAKSTAPTLDNDGNTLLVGALYYDTPSAVMKVWSGTAWLAAYASSSGAMLSANNLSDVASVSGSRTNLGLGTTDTPQFAKLGIGTSTNATTNLVVSSDISGGTTAYNIYSGPTIRSGVTTLASNNLSIVVTEAAAFTLATFRNFDCVGPSIGAGSAITTLVGYGVRALSQATNNYGFQGAVAAATGRYNLYMSGTADNYLAGSLGIGTTALTGFNLNNTKNITGSVNSYAYNTSSTIQSDVTSTGVGYNTFIGTQAAAFTLGSLLHFTATQGTIGAGSAVTAQIGFYAQSSLIGGTTNRAFQGSLAAATGRYNLYMNGTADNYLAGVTLIGTTTNTLSGQLVSSGQIIETTGSVQYNIASQYDIGIAANQIPLNQYLGTLAFQNSEAISGGTATLTGQLNLTNASNYNLYASGAGNNYMAGSLGVGIIPATGISLHVKKNLTGGGAYNTGLTNEGIIQNDTTFAGTYFWSTANLQATAWTLPSLYHYRTYQNTFTGSSAATTQYGFSADATLTGATNNYGFHGNIAAATGRYNLYMAGTADNYLAGSLGIGTTSLTDTALSIGKNATGATTVRGIRNFSQVQSDVTAAYQIFQTAVTTAAASFTLTNISHFDTNQGTIGAGSAVTNQFGFSANTSLTGATNNYGFYGNIAAATGRYNLYMGGTANNYLAGSLGIGTTTTTAAQLTVAGSASIAALKVPNIKEVITVSATAATGTINYDITTQSVLYYTSNASANWTVNFRGSSGTSLDTLMATGETMSATFMVTQGTTAYYNSAVTIDGTAVTPKWVGGSAPTSGNVSSIESYTYAIIKTGAATFTVLASRTKFA